MVLKKRLKLDVSFNPVYIKPIHNQQHLINTFFYILDQNEHHGVNSDPFYEGSIIPDILGLRVLPKPLPNTLSQYLPRIKKSDLPSLAKLDLHAEITDLTPLPQATTAAVGIHRLDKKCKKSMAARTAAIHIAESKIPNSTLAEWLNISPRSVRRLKSHQPDPTLLKAVMGQLRIRQISGTYQIDSKPHRPASEPVNKISNTFQTAF